MCSEGWLSEIIPLTDKPKIGYTGKQTPLERERRIGERGRPREEEEHSPWRVLCGVAEVVGGGWYPPKKVGWRAVGGGAYRSSSPGEIIGGLVGMLVSKTWWKDARRMITLWTSQPPPSCLRAAFHEITRVSKWKEQWESKRGRRYALAFLLSHVFSYVMHWYADSFDTERLKWWWVSVISKSNCQEVFSLWNCKKLCFNTGVCIH